MSTKKPRKFIQKHTIVFSDECTDYLESKKGGIIDLTNGCVVTKDGRRIPFNSSSGALELNHDRETKEPKKIFEIYEEQIITPSVDSNYYLKKFKHVCAVDTNVKNHINITAAFIHKIQENSYEEVTRQVNSHFTSDGIDKEKIGWLLALKLIEETLGNENVLLITDAHQSELRDIQKRIKPMCGSLFLPPNRSIMYASADGAKRNDSGYNHIINHTDRFIN